MKKLLLPLFFSLILVLGLGTAAQAGDFVLSLDYQDLGSDISVGDLVDWKGSGSAFSLDGQYYFTPQCSLELGYAHASFSHDLLGLIGVDNTYNVWNLQLNYLFPISDKFSLGGFFGYKDHSLSGDLSGSDILPISYDDLYNLKMSGFVLGIKMAYKATDQFTLEASYGEIISPNMDIKALGYNIPDQYFDNPYYRQFDIVGIYWITPSVALRAGYSKIWAGFDIPLLASIPAYNLDQIDLTSDGLHVGLACKF